MRTLALAALLLALPAAACAQTSESTAAQIRQREELRPFHIAFGTSAGLASWASTVIGFLTFHDRYGWDGDPASSGCAQGSPLLGADMCSGVALPHTILAATSATLFTTAFTIALFMPDPLNVADGRNELGTMLTIHKGLRWALLAMMVGQIFLGIVTANIEADFETRRGLAIGHLALGATMWATMTTQGLLGSLMTW
jgi:hypothetical protein